MVIRAKDREPDQIIQDYLSAKARTDILGAGFQPTENQLNELRNIINIFGEYSLSRSRKHKVVKKTGKPLTRVKAKVKLAMEHFEEGKMHSGKKTGPVVTNPKQAIAVALSMGRKASRTPKKKK